MSITELIAELERQAAIAKEAGFDPSKVSVLIPNSPEILTVWDEVGDCRVEKTDNGTVYDVYLTN